VDANQVALGQRRECPDVCSVVRARTTVNSIFAETNLMSRKIIYRGRMGTIRNERGRKVIEEKSKAPPSEKPRTGHPALTSDQTRDNRCVQHGHAALSRSSFIQLRGTLVENTARLYLGTSNLRSYASKVVRVFPYSTKSFTSAARFDNGPSMADGVVLRLSFQP